jgi:pilus assembly protein Flp/PilA
MLEVTTMLDFKKLFRKQTEEKEGQGLVEYALILFLVAVVVIAILVFLGPQIGNVFSSVTKNLS